MSLVFLKILRLLFSFRLVKTECQQDFSDLLLNFSIQVPYFNLDPPRIISLRTTTSSFNSSQIDHSFSDWAAFSGFQLIQFFFLIEPPFRVFNSTFFHFFLFLFHFTFFFHSIIHLRIQNLLKRDEKFRRIISSKTLLIFNSSRNKLFSLGIYVWSKWTFKVRNVG